MGKKHDILWENMIKGVWIPVLLLPIGYSLAADGTIYGFVFVFHVMTRFDAVPVSLVLVIMIRFIM